jgi:putative phage-type endonuclease
MSLTDLQKEQRRSYICGSDAAVICGLSPYKNQVELWQEKLGLIQERDISNNPYVKAGNFLENAILKWFAHDTGLVCWHETEMLYCDEIQDQEFMAANIDGWVKTPEGMCVLEIKTASSDIGWGESGGCQIPDHYLLQVTHYMAVTGCPKAYVAVLIRGVDFRYYIIDRNEKLEEILIEKESRFWECVKNQVPPDPTTGAEIISLHGFKCIDESVVADGDIHDCITRLRDVKKDIDDLSKAKEELEDKIKVFMGQNDTLIDLYGKVAATWKSPGKDSSFDKPRRFLVKKIEGL